MDPLGFIVSENFESLDGDAVTKALESVVVHKRSLTHLPILWPQIPYIDLNRMFSFIQALGLRTPCRPDINAGFHVVCHFLIRLILHYWQ